MGKRTSVLKLDTPKLQGEGSWIKIAGMKVHEIREYRRLSNLEPEKGKEDEFVKFDAFEGGVDMIKTHVLAWNWVDDNDEPLAQVPDDPSVVDELTNEESEFISNVLLYGRPEEEDVKNSEGG